MSDDLKPAFKLEEEAPKELSAEEFQRQLYAWFEDRGLLSELRARLRMQMIGVLKDTALGRSFSAQIKQSISPKLQAINLLIAEFFLHQEYHYSLCVFSTEVPLANVFPDFANNIIRNSANVNDPKKWRFNAKDVKDILETFGIMHDSEECKNISNMYYGNYDEALLTCIVRTLHSLSTRSSNFDINRNRIGTIIADNDDKVWTLENIGELLSRVFNNKQIAIEIENCLRKVVNNEKERLAQEHKEEYARLSARLEEESSRRIEKYKRKVTEIEKTFEIERKKLEDELHCTKSSLKECAETLHNRFDKLEEQERMLRNRERELKKQEELIQRTRMSLENERQTLNKDKFDLMQMKHQTQKDFDGKEQQIKKDKEFFQKLQEDCNNFKSDLRQTCDVVSEKIVNLKKQTVDKFQQTSDNCDVEGALMRQLVRHLQNENNVLRNQNRDQQTRVQQLAQNASLLIRELSNNDARATSSFGANFRGVSTVAPLVAPSMPSLSINTNNGLMVSNGSGEELSVRPPVPARYYRHTVLPRETRRRLLNRRHSNSSSSDDPSPTEDILREARERLRNLEMESEEIDRNFRNYNSRIGRSSSPAHRDREVTNPTNSDAFYFSTRNKLNHLSLSDRFSISINNMDNNITRILTEEGRGRERNSNRNTYRIVQHDVPSTSTAPAFNYDSLNMLNTKTEKTNEDNQDKGKSIKNREQNKLFLQNMSNEKLNSDSKDNLYHDVMKLLGAPSTSKASDSKEHIDNEDGLIEEDLKDNRASTGQSGNTSGYLQDMLPGTSGISFSSIEITSSDHEDLSIKKKETG